MLEKIIEGSKTLIKKGKKLIKKGKKALLIGLTGLTLCYASGCGTITGRKWVTIDTYKERESEKIYKKIKLVYNIKKLDKVNRTFFVPVTEARTIETYKEDTMVTKEKQRLYEIYKQEDGGVPGFLIGALIGGVIGGTIAEKKQSPPGEGLGICIGMDLLGMSIGYLIGNDLHPEEIKRKATNQQRTIIVSKYTDTNRINIETIHHNKPKNIKVQASPKELFENYLTKTGNQGIATFSLNLKRLPFNKAFSKETLEEKLKNSELVNDIKEHIRDQLLKEFYKRIVKYPLELKFETKEEAISEEILKVTNDSKKTKTSIYTVPEEKIYMVLEEYINKEINSKIKEVRIKVKDASTHTPVRNANLEIKTQAPTKLDLAKKYFEDELLNWSLRKIKTYITGTETIKYDDNGTAVFSAYILNNYKTETTHPKYRFVILNFDFSNKKLKKTIYMSKDPKLIKIVDE